MHTYLRNAGKSIGELFLAGLRTLLRIGFALLVLAAVLASLVLALPFIVLASVFGRLRYELDERWTAEGGDEDPEDDEPLCSQCRESGCETCEATPAANAPASTASSAAKIGSCDKILRQDPAT